MALKSTIYKAELQIADMDRHYYQTHTLTMARHPSETDERLMIRLLAFAFHASDSLEFAKGLSDVDEPDLWQKDLTGAIELWIETGQPDERRLMKASGRANEVAVYCYSAASPIWFKPLKLDRARGLSVYHIPPETSQQLEAMAQRTMQLQCTIQDGQLWLTDGERTVQVERQRWHG